METKEKMPELQYNYNLLARAEVGREYLERGTEEGYNLARKSLEKTLEDIGRNEKWISETLIDPRIIRKTLENQLRDFNNYRKQDSIENILDYYKETFEDSLEEENKERAEKELDEFKEKTYGEIKEEYEKCKHMIEGFEKYGIGDKDEIKDAKKDANKYEKVIVTINLLERREIDKFKNETENDFAKELLNELYAKKTDNYEDSKTE